MSIDDYVRKEQAAPVVDVLAVVDAAGHAAAEAVALMLKAALLGYGYAGTGIRIVSGGRGTVYVNIELRRHG